MEALAGPVHFLKRLMWAAFLVPVQSPSGWQQSRFNGIPANQVEFSTVGIHIQIKKSSSPLVYPLPSVQRVLGFRATLEIHGEIKSATNAWPEDAYLRVGLVAPGKRRLGFGERLVAAPWIKQLFALAPNGMGIDKIHFFNLVAGGGSIGKKRDLPKAKGLIDEMILAERLPTAKKMIFEYKLPGPMDVIALWLSVDGDDTSSSFEIDLQELKLNVAD